MLVNLCFFCLLNVKFQGIQTTVCNEFMLKNDKTFFSFTYSRLREAIILVC